MTASIYLVKGREKSLRRRHPWVFSRGIQRVEGKPALGETVDIFDHKGEWLARGAFSPQSQIRVRVWTFERNESIDVDFFVKRLNTAQGLRDILAARDGLTGYRLIAEVAWVAGAADRAAAASPWRNTLVAAALRASMSLISDLRIWRWNRPCFASAALR